MGNPGEMERRETTGSRHFSIRNSAYVSIGIIGIINNIPQCNH